MLITVAIAMAAVAWPVAGLAALALILPMPEPDVFQPVYVDAVILAATVSWLPTHPRARFRAAHKGYIRLSALAIGYGALCAISVLPFVSGHPGGVGTIGRAAGNPHTLCGGHLHGRELPVSLGSSLLAIISVLLLGGLLRSGARPPRLHACWAARVLGRSSCVPSGTTDTLLPGGNRPRQWRFRHRELPRLLCRPILAARDRRLVARSARRYRPLLAIVMATLVAALVVSYSRSAYIGMAAGIVALVALRSPRRAVLLVAIGAVAGIALYPGVP